MSPSTNASKDPSTATWKRGVPLDGTVSTSLNDASRGKDPRTVYRPPHHAHHGRRHEDGRLEEGEIPERGSSRYHSAQSSSAAVGLDPRFLFGLRQATASLHEKVNLLTSKVDTLTSMVETLVAPQDRSKQDRFATARTPEAYPATSSKPSVMTGEASAKQDRPKRTERAEPSGANAQRIATSHSSSGKDSRKRAFGADNEEHVAKNVRFKTHQDADTRKRKAATNDIDVTKTVRTGTTVVAVRDTESSKRTGVAEKQHANAAKMASKKVRVETTSNQVTVSHDTDTREVTMEKHIANATTTVPSKTTVRDTNIDSTKVATDKGNVLVTEKASTTIVHSTNAHKRSVAHEKENVGDARNTNAHKRTAAKGKKHVGDARNTNARKPTVTKGKENDGDAISTNAESQNPTVAKGKDNVDTTKRNTLVIKTSHHVTTVENTDDDFDDVTFLKALLSSKKKLGRVTKDSLMKACGAREIEADKKLKKVDLVSRLIDRAT